jgi:hypothetical protein
MLQPSKMISITRQLEALRQECPSLEDAITEAEVRFRDEELEHDWSSQPIEMAVPPMPSCWKAGIARSTPIAIAYAKAKARKETDPAKFEQFTEDVVVAVAQDTLLNKLAGYAQTPGSLSSPVIDKFIADAQAETKQTMKKLRQDVLKRRKGLPRTGVSSAPSEIGAGPAQSDERKPVAKKKKPATRRKPLPNVVDLVAGKDFISREHAAEWFGTSPRHLRTLIDMGRVEVRGEGHNRVISVASLRGYFGV